MSKIYLKILSKLKYYLILIIVINKKSYLEKTINLMLMM